MYRLLKEALWNIAGAIVGGAVMLLLHGRGIYPEQYLADQMDWVISDPAALREWRWAAVAGAAVVGALFGHFILAFVERKRTPVSRPPQGLDERAQSVAQRINVLGAKYPLMMPDHPEYQRVGHGRNDAANEAYLREYRETIATDAASIMEDADKRKLLDDLDRTYKNHGVVGRQGVEEIGRAMIRVATNVRDGHRAPPPSDYAPTSLKEESPPLPAPTKPDPDLRLAEFVRERDYAAAAEDYFVAVSSLFDNIRQAAVLGAISVWGRENCPIGQTHSPVALIPSDHWRGASIDLEIYLKSFEGTAGRTKPPRFGDQTYYSDLWLNRNQVDATWPPPSFMSLKEAMEKAYGTLRLTDFKDQLPTSSESVIDPLSFLAEIMSYRGLRIYGKHAYSSVREPISMDELNRLAFQNKATELHGDFTIKGPKYADLEVEAADFEARLESMVKENLQ